MRTTIIFYLMLLVSFGGHALSLYVHVSKEGNLTNQIDISNVAEIDSLTISGYIDHYDIACLRDFPNLSYIDMKEAHIEYIISEAFKNAKNLKTIILPQTISNIGSRAFENCQNLDSINIPVNVTCIYSDAFANCTNLKKVNLPINLRELELGVFSNCYNLKSILLPDSLVKIGEIYEASTSRGTFENCLQLESIKFPSKLEIIGLNSFKGCRSLETIEFSESNNWIHNSAFQDCVSLEYLSFPSKISYFGKSAFKGCSSLIEIDMTKCMVEHSAWSSVTLGDACFMDCSQLRIVKCPHSMDFALNSFVFMNCTNLERVIFAPLYSDVSIGKSCFASCNSLKEIQLPQGISFIGEKAFYDCNILSSITLPSTLTEIRNNAFYGCPLNMVYSHNCNPPLIYEYTFDAKTYKTATLYIPDGYINKYVFGEYWEKFIYIEAVDFSSSIDSVNYELTENNRIYNINGVLRQETDINQLENGIYIVNGKKVLIRR